MKLKELTRCEEMVFMSVLNAEENVNLPEIVEQVNYRYKQQWKPQTVSTFLRRIIEKGYIEMWRKGRTFYYYSLVTMEEYQRVRLQEVVEMCFQNDWKKVDRCMHKIISQNKERE